MENHIKHLSIHNFKSLKDIEMDCSRINLIVGKPNVGKSNILEALSLFCFDYVQDYNKIYSSFIRYDEIGELFFDQNISEEITIKSNIGSTLITSNRSNKRQGWFHFRMNNFNNQIDLIGSKKAERDAISQNNIFFETNEKGSLADAPISSVSHVKKYRYVEGAEINELNNTFLAPPYGSNLFSIILQNRELREEIAAWFSEYNLDLVLDKRTKTISAQKREGNIVYPISYNLLADTLKRMIFYHAAISSNQDSILLFEEPENHSFPPYVHQMAQNIIHDENNNQYFITTHSPHLFNTIVENTPVEEQSIFIANYQNYQTTIKKLSKEERSELLEYGIDIFFNTKYFLNE